MTCYVIGDRKGFFIRFDQASGRYCPIRSRTQAVEWTDKEKAAKVLGNALGKDLRKRFEILHTEALERGPEGLAPEPEEKPQVEPVADETISQMNQRIARTDRIKSILSAQVETADERIEEIASDPKKYMNYVFNLDYNRDNALQRLSDIDSEIADLNHYIELGPALNAYEGWLIYTALQQRLQRRRVVKDELLFIQYIGESQTSVGRRVAGLKNRQYSARKLMMLFPQEAAN